MNSIIKSKYFRLSLSIVVLALFGFYFFRNVDKFKPLLDLNPLLLVVISFLFCLMVAINGVFTKLIIEPFKKIIPLYESVYLAIISSVGNFFAPAGAGYGFRAVYLKKKYNLSYADYTATLSGYYILIIMVNSLAGLLALILLGSKNNHNYKLVFLALLGAFLFSLFFSIFKIKKEKLPKVKKSLYKKLLELFSRISEGWSDITSDRMLMLKLVLLTLVTLAMSMTMTGLIIASLHLSTSFAAIMLYSVLGSLSLFINITPGNIGIKEGILLFSAGVMGFSIDQIILIAIVERGIIFITLLYLWLFSERMKSKLSLLNP